MPDVNGRFKEVDVGTPHQAICTVGAHEQIRPLEFAYVCHIAVELQVHSELAAAPLQDVQKGKARNRGKLVAPDRNLLTFVDDVDVVPDLAIRSDLAAGLAVA